MRKKFTIFIIAVFVILLFAAVWHYQRNIYSKEILKVEVLGPAETELAQEVEYTVRYKNNGNILLEKPKLIFEFPKSSIDISGPAGNSLRQEKELSDIYPGEEKTITFKARLLGKENDARTAKVWLNYQPKNLTARYESATTFTTIIKNVPLTFEFDIPSRVNSEKENVFILNYFSNLNFPLSDLRVKINYPDGFSLKESRPKSLGDNEWEIPVLNKTEGGRIEISGTLNGGVGDTKIFKASLGVWHGGEFILLKETAWETQIAQPSIFISQKINDSPQYVASPGDYLHYQITFKNTGDRDLENLFIAVQLNKEVFDFNTAQAGSGKVQKDDGSIVWDINSLPSLKVFPVLAEGNVEFWIKLKNDLPRSPVISTKVSVGLAQETFVNKIGASISLIQRGFYEEGPFKNSGPVPPQAGQPTTYTASWQVKNFYNDIKNLKIKAVLPLNVKLTGQLMPNNIKFTFDQASREIVWEAGDLAIDATSPQVFFQLSLTPDASQKGQAAKLFSNVKIIGDDSWVGQGIQLGESDMDTNLFDESRIVSGQGIVQ